MMRLFDIIKHFLTPGEYEEEHVQSYLDEDEEQESYYVPPTELSFEQKPSSVEPDISHVKEASPIFEDDSNELASVVNMTAPESVVLDNDKVTERTPIQTTGNNDISNLQDTIISIIEEFDSYINRINNDDARELVSLFQHRLIESLAESGLDKIDNDTLFDSLRHVAVPFRIIPKGSKIIDIHRPGLLRNDVVVLKALVAVSFANG